MMKNKIKVFVCVLSYLIFNSCISNIKREEDNGVFLFKKNKIESIGFSKNGDQNYTKLNDTLLLKQVNQALAKINSEELIKGRRQHGAKNLYSLKLTKNGNNLLLFVNQTKDNKITIDFFEVDKKDNFTYFIGCLYDSKTLFEVFNKWLNKLGET